MTRTPPVEEGSYAWTPCPPRGLVKVLEIEGEHPVALIRRTARVLYLHDHAGYPAWSEGSYFLDELVPMGWLSCD